MICTECGAQLMDTDQFCPKCGTRVKREKRCPDCGAVLRDGTKFCHKCGRLVEGSDSGQQASEETLDIPIDMIEQNILSETAAEIKAGRGDRSKPRRTSSQESAERRASSREISSGKAAAGSFSSREVSSKGTAARSSASRNTLSGGSAERSASGQGSSAKGMSSKSASGHGASNGRRSAEPPVRKKTSNPEPPRKKRIEYRDDDWDDEDWEDDDWDDDDDEGVDIITIMTAVIGCVLLAVVAILGYNLYKQYAPKSYEQGIEEEVPEDAVDAEEEQEQGQEVESGQQMPEDSSDGTYMITVISNVNVRDKPSTSGSSVLMVAQAGDVYTCYGSTEDGEWYEIRLEDGTPAYVFHEYIAVNEIDTEAE